MAQYSKGQETKSKIILSARKLFYEKGYRETSSRDISENAGTNLGLLKYYFGGKGELAILIYDDIRQTFDRMTVEYEPSIQGADLFLFSSALELYLCHENHSFGRLYYELSSETSFHNKMETIIVNALMKYAQKKGDQQYALLSCLSIMAIKPALVGQVLRPDNQIPAETCVRYYLEQQLHVLGFPLSYSDVILQALKRYYINIGPVFTPIMTPLIS